MKSTYKFTVTLLGMVTCRAATRWCHERGVSKKGLHQMGRHILVVIWCNPYTLFRKKWLFCSILRLKGHRKIVLSPSVIKPLEIRRKGNQYSL